MQDEHASRLAASWTADLAAPTWRELHGSAVLADISGFTRLTERLTDRGAEGPEVLHAAICAALTALLGVGIVAGGDVIGFAGDSAVWFDGSDHPEHAARGGGGPPCGCRGDMTALPASTTGGRRLRVSVGVHTGVVQAHLVGDARAVLFLCGADMSQLVALQDRAEPGQVLMSAATAAHVAPSWRAAPVGDGFAVRPGRRAASPVTSGTAVSARALPETCASLFAPAVRELIAAGAAHGDFRTASFGFLKVWGIDRVAEREGVAGVHAARPRRRTCHPHRRGRGRRVARRVAGRGTARACCCRRARPANRARRGSVVDRAPSPGGRVRGAGECCCSAVAVYWGMLGVAGRRRQYTVMGDAVNVAALPVSGWRNPATWWWVTGWRCLPGGRSCTPRRWASSR